MKTKKGNFIELDFVASVKDGNVFDTTKEEEAKKTGLVNEKERREFKPLEICIGESMVIKGLDNALTDKEINREYEVEIGSKEAFGVRNAKLMKTVPLSAFKEMPVPGMFVNVNGMIARVVTVTSGRALIDLNNPLAGKVVVYKFRINKIIEDNNKKIKLLARSFGVGVESVKIENKKAKIKVKNKKEVDEAKVLEKFKDKIKTIMGIEAEFE
ncbi:MAG: FKBP-type peptidyl-prolyl cis-trans isomerase [Candidatus Pacearchaeota archaeon]|nr:MAG: FKBP-type peptidyl-prolyl cis-trans isomerase [Candidatus Pacearchaeota archaeon]